jgi:hypothetical protein
MGTDYIRDRSRALENAFFAKRDAEKLAALRAKLAKEARVAELATASGIEDHEVLETLVELDIRAETYAALTLVPMIEVAWADGTLDRKERAAVLKSAAGQGVKEGTPAYGLLESWLEARPGKELLEAWFEYLKALMERLPPNGQREFKRALVGRAQQVAEATGGFLGLGSKISDSEREVLDALNAAFPDA